jgi:hypothetical protein
LPSWILALAEAAGWLALWHRFESIPTTLILLGVNLKSGDYRDIQRAGGAVVAKPYGGPAGEAPSP